MTLHTLLLYLTTSSTSLTPRPAEDAEKNDTSDRYADPGSKEGGGGGTKGCPGPDEAGSTWTTRVTNDEKKGDPTVNYAYIAHVDRSIHSLTPGSSAVPGGPYCPSRYISV